MSEDIRRFLSLEELSLRAAETIAALAQERVHKHGSFSLVLSGGRTPRRLYELLARPPFDRSMPWAQTHIFWGDERCVHREHPDSNFAMAFKALLSKAPIPKGNIHAVPVEIEPGPLAAETYENILRTFFDSVSRPGFDLILLGVGKDGHTASLFPGDKVLEEKKRWTAAVRAPQGTPSVPRITLTLPAINAADQAMFLASGKEKIDLIDSILSGSTGKGGLCPAALVRPRGRRSWFMEPGAGQEVSL